MPSWLRSARRPGPRQKRWCRVLAPIAVGWVVLVVVGAAAAIPTANLYAALLTTTYPKAQLPGGFTSAKVSRLTPNKQGHRDHVVGEVQVAVDGPDATDGIFFVVYPSASAAKGDLARANVSGTLHLAASQVPTYPTLPGRVYNGRIAGPTVMGGKVTDGFTLVIVAERNVLVEAFTASADRTDSGNEPAALLLLKSALHHLANINTTLKH